ncbi:MAG TPA: transketolase [Acetobacteraceae bacterium]|nr:transketolase [Acetobacteraceae bacterium]
MANFAESAVLAVPATKPARRAGPEPKPANALRALAIDAVEAARSGHPGMPLGMADAATVLWTRFLKFDAADPRWPDRDRFVLSAGHGSMLLYALLHLTGFAGMEMDALRRFRKLHSAAAGHPEVGLHPAIETTTGPLGQGLAAAVGMALAERLLAARFGRSLVDHRTWVIASDGDLMEGLSHEAAGLAGHLKLARLTVLYDDNAISIDGPTALAVSDDPLKRFAALGWSVKRVDGHDPAAVAAALSAASRSQRPSLIACRTVIGYGAPHKAGTAAVHGSALGADEAAATKQALGWDAPPFTVPDDIAASWRATGLRGASQRRAWLKRLAHHPLRAEFERVMSGRLPDASHAALATLKAEFAATRPRLATRQSSQKVLEALVPAVPELIGGSADLTASNLTGVRGTASVAPGSFAGRYIHYGVREHGMAAAMNGMARHGGIIPYGGTFLVFSDYMRPAMRLASLMEARVIYVLTHDSIGLGEDGPTHQPIEHLASFRAMPNFFVFRPADAVETAECWELALRRAEGPSALVLTRQALPGLRAQAGENLCARGGYVLAEATSARRATLIATGSEVSIAMAARRALEASGIATAVVSLPCWEIFAAQEAAWRESVLGTGLRVGVEAAGAFGWERWLGPDGVFIGMKGFGASAPAEDLYRHFGITAEAVESAVRERVGQGIR